MRRSKFIERTMNLQCPWSATDAQVIENANENRAAPQHTSLRINADQRQLARCRHFSLLNDNHRTAQTKNRSPAPAAIGPHFLIFNLPSKLICARASRAVVD